MFIPDMLVKLHQSLEFGFVTPKIQSKISESLQQLAVRSTVSIYTKIKAYNSIAVIKHRDSPTAVLTLSDVNTFHKKASRIHASTLPTKFSRILTFNA